MLRQTSTRLLSLAPLALASLTFVSAAATAQNTCPPSGTLTPGEYRYLRNDCSVSRFVMYVPGNALDPMDVNNFDNQKFSFIGTQDVYSTVGYYKVGQGATPNTTGNSPQTFGVTIGEIVDGANTVGTADWGWDVHDNMPGQRKKWLASFNGIFSDGANGSIDSGVRPFDLQIMLDSYDPVTNGRWGVGTDSSGPDSESYVVKDPATGRPMVWKINNSNWQLTYGWSSHQTNKLNATWHLIPSDPSITSVTQLNIKEMLRASRDKAGQIPPTVYPQLDRVRSHAANSTYTIRGFVAGFEYYVGHLSFTTPGSFLADFH